MDKPDKLRITKNWGTLTSDLDDKDIVDYLIQDSILTPDDVEEIKSKAVRRSCVQELLTKLMRKGPRAYACFREALQHHYPWLVKQLDDTDVTEAVRASVAGLDSLTDTSTITFMRLGQNATVQTNWRMLGLSLGVNESDLVNLEYENRQKIGNLSDLVFDTLTRWTQTRGSAATLDELKASLRNIGVTSLT